MPRGVRSAADVLLQSRARIGTRFTPRVGEKPGVLQVDVLNNAATF